MGAFGWIAVGAVVLAIGWFAVQVLVGRVVPLRVSGALLFKQELRKCGVQVDSLPREFFDECISWAEGVSEFTSFGSSAAFSRQAEFVRTIETLARTAALWVREPDCAMFTLRGTPPTNTYRAMFEKYDIKAVPK